MIYYQDQNIKIRDIRSDDIINLFSCWVDKEINLYDPRPLPNTSEELINECLSFCNRIYIETSETNIPALRLFDKLGFDKCGEVIEKRVI